MTQEREMEGEFKINKMNLLLNRLLTEKKKLEDYYTFEVKEKQELVLALAKEKKILASELQGLLKEVRKSKHKIKKHTGKNSTSFRKGAMQAPSPSRLTQSTPHQMMSLSNFNTSSGS